MTARSSLTGLAALILTFAGLERAAAADPFETVFATQPSGKACFARDYDRARLEAHPRQKVARIQLDMTPSNPDGVPDEPSRFELGVRLMPKGKSEWYGGNAICKTEGAIFTCFLEGDGGNLKLTPLQGDGLKVETTRIALEGSDFFEISAGKSDDLVFLLRRAPRAKCDSAG